MTCEFFKGSSSARFDILVCVFLMESRFAYNILTFAFFARLDGVSSVFDGSNRSEVVDILVSDFLLATICSARFFYIFYIIKRVRSVRSHDEIFFTFRRNVMSSLRKKFEKFS